MCVCVCVCVCVCTRTHVWVWFERVEDLLSLRLNVLCACILQELGRRDSQEDMAFYPFPGRARFSTFAFTLDKKVMGKAVLALVNWCFKGFYWPKSETKTMYKKSESDISVCYTINRAGIKGEVVVHRNIGFRLFVHRFRFAFWSIKSFETSECESRIVGHLPCYVNWCWLLSWKQSKDKIIITLQYGNRTQPNLEKNYTVKSLLSAVLNLAPTSIYRWSSKHGWK